MFAQLLLDNVQIENYLLLLLSKEYISFSIRNSNCMAVAVAT
jgi:hypothetical protein